MFSKYLVLKFMYVQRVYCSCKQMIETMTLFHFPKVNMYIELN